MKGDGIQLHGIIVTHPDGDHLSGINILFEKYGPKILNHCDVVITRAFFWRYYKDEMSKKFINLINTTSARRDDIKTQECMTAGLQCHFSTELGCVFRHTQQKDRYTGPLKRTFRKPEGINANKASILTTVNLSKEECGAVFTGDLIAKHIMPLVRSKTIGIFQVPHHGDYWMSRLEISHNVQNCCQEVKKILEKCSEKVKETLLFYSSFRAKCYIISAGGTEPHPHFSVLQGIILANSLQRQECVILLTNSHGLNLGKLKGLRRLDPEWTQYVKIYHYDDVFFTEQCHMSLHPERCISDVRTNAIEWTPEGYINNIRRKLKTVTQTMCNCRPLGKQCFAEKSVVQIIAKWKKGELKFNAHIICAPLPHNPRSGDNINFCYVIEESIASGAHFSQVLFLLTRKQRLSRAKAYILFQYINNEWKIREFSATVQDCSPKTHIPYNNIKLRHSLTFSLVCCVCNEDIITLHDTVSCYRRGCLSCAHAECTGHTERGANKGTTFICPNHNTCCLCKTVIARVHGTVSCNQQHQGCLNQAHALCAGYRKKQASRITNFTCPSHTCCLCRKDIDYDNDIILCSQEDQGCLNRAHEECAEYNERGASKVITFVCPSHTCCLCKKDIVQDGGIVSCRQEHQRCLNRAHAQCAGYTKREARKATTFACPRHSCCICERDIVKDYGTVSCKHHYSDQGCLNRAHAWCAGYKARRASRVKRFSCPSCR